MELPETYKWLKKVEATLGIKIKRLGANLETIIANYGILPSARVRYCTRESKIFPMNDWLAGEEATLYIGIRADEDRTGARAELKQTIAYPLKDLGIGLAGVYSVVRKVDLMPPNFFWKRLHDTVKDGLGDTAFVIEELPQWVFDRTFAWRSRPNCFMCFYQRRYEWVGLLEHHPELFDRSEKLEKDYGESNDTRTHAFCFINGLPLSTLRTLAGDLFQKRVNAVIGMLSKRLQKDLWTDALIDDMEMANKSCGIFCGK